MMWLQEREWRGRGGHSLECIQDWWVSPHTMDTISTFFFASSDWVKGREVHRGAGENCGVFAFIGGKDRAPGIAPGTSMSCHLSPPAECIPNTVFSSVSCVMCACRNELLVSRRDSTTF